MEDPKIENILAAGGRRSGKTIAICNGIFLRAEACPGSTHGFFHETRTSCERNLFAHNGSFIEALNIILPGYFDFMVADERIQINYSDLTIRLENGSTLMFMGLDDPHKLRGLKLSTAFVNEANRIPYETIMTLVGTLSESLPITTGGMMTPKLVVDLNPTTKASWDYQVFVEGKVPGDGTPIPDHKEAYRYITINPIDNKKNLPDALFKQFDKMTAEQQRRDRWGMWGEHNPNALFDATKIMRRYCNPDDLSEIVVAIDPAGTSNAASDSTGIIVAGRDTDGLLYVIEDATMKGKPDVWLKRAEELRVKYDANWIVTEKDYARDILEALVPRVIPGAPIKYVESRGRGKRLRAEPVAALYERGAVNHLKVFSELETQMVEFDAPTFKGSPDRVDALVYALQHLSGSTKDTMPVVATASGFWR